MTMAIGERSRSAGFTLLELMIVVVIIAILAALALPAYSKYVQRTRRSDAQSMLLNSQQAEEKFFYRCSRYGSMQEIFGITTPLNCATTAAAGTAIISPQKYYSVAITQIDAAGIANAQYKLQATPQGVQATDPCGALTLDSKGNKDALGDASFSTDGDPLRCWH
jgi:type IV pilus assembly protein PilE